MAILDQGGGHATAQYIWPIIAVLALLILGIAIALYSRKGKPQKEPDYRVFFILGMAWFPIGIASDNMAFFVLGLAYMAIGLANRDKWNPKM